VSGSELKQRLAAILAADVAGYSRLMAADERTTVAALDAARAVFRAQIESNQGRVIDMAGDSVLAVFETATGAVSAALAVQRSLDAAPNAVPEDRRMRFRIGLHMGDVMEKGDGTIYGDGVNIAARLEGLAEPGGITVSESIRTAVKGKVSAGFEDQGEQTVKNIPDPVRAYRVRGDGAAAPRVSPSVGEIDLSLPDKPSIGVLPFDNMSGDPEQAYFADGIAEDIITALSRFRQFHVTARNSSFAYKGQATDIKKVGRELGVRYVLEGSVRKTADRVRITAQLIDAESGNHVWADRYDGKLENIFDLQDEITNTIAAAVTPAFAKAELQRISRKRPESLDAWDLTLRSSQRSALGGPADIAAARELAERAVLLDERNTEALARLAFCHVTEGWLGYSPSPSASIAEGIKVARLALQEDNTDANSLISLGFGLFAARQFDEALDVLRQAVALNSNNAAGLVCYGMCMGFCGDYDKAIGALDRAIRLSPRDPGLGIWIAQMALAAFVVEQYQEGVGYGRRAVQNTPGFMGAHRALAANLSALGQMEEAKREVAEMRRIMPELTVAKTRTLPFREDEARERYCAALARAGLPEG
jgi:adenylate cyclase